MAVLLWRKCLGVEVWPDLSVLFLLLIIHSIIKTLNKQMRATIEHVKETLISLVLVQPATAARREPRLVASGQRPLGV